MRSSTFRCPTQGIMKVEVTMSREVVELKEAEEKSLKELERSQKKIAEVQELKKNTSTMTANEYFEKHAELKKKFDDDTRNKYWGYWEFMCFLEPTSHFKS